MDRAFQAKIPAAVERAILRYRVPGLVVAAIDSSGQSHEFVAGTDARGRPLARESIFPVASITKLATALAVLRLVDAGLIHLDHPISTMLPDAVSANFGVTARRLLSHSSGLPYDLDDSSGPLPPDENWPRLAERCLQTPREAPPGTRVRYSNVGYGLLAIMVERAHGREFPDALRELVIVPLGIDAWFGVEPNRQPVLVADVRSTYTGTPYEPFNTIGWYRRALPWSGLLTNAAGALTLARAFQSAQATLVRAETADDAVSNQNDELSGGFVPPLIWKTCWWGLGPDLRNSKSPHWTPASASPRTFGHAGASGSSVYVDPEQNVAWAILGSRTADNGWLLLAGPAIAAAVLDDR
jgi:beta-lactamase class C